MNPAPPLADAQALLQQGALPAAIAAFEALCEQLPAEDERRSAALLGLAEALPRIGRNTDAVRAAAEALGWYESRDDALGRCDAHARLAMAYAQLGVGREALDHALQALELARALHDREREAWALVRVGNAHAALDNPVQARETTQQAREIAAQLGHAELEYACLNNQAYYTLDELDRLRFDGLDDQLPVVQAMGQLLAEQALERAREQGNPFREGMALAIANEARLHALETEGVAERIDELASLAARHGFPTLQVFARLQRAQLATRRGQWASGIAQVRELLHERNDAMLPRQRRAALQLLYESHKAINDTAEALACLEQLMQIERRSTREQQLLQTQLLMIRQEVHRAMRMAEYASADAHDARQRARELEADQTRLQQLLEDTEREAREDALTGLANRRHAEQVLQLLTDAARRERRALTLALLDIDHFKRVNDQHGHDIGDRVLREVALLLRDQLREADLLARWGGEEFLVVLGPAGAAESAAVLERLRRSLHSADWERIAPGLRVTLSGGCCRRVPTDDGWAAQLKQADEALYAAKNAGRDRIAFA